MPNSDKTMSKLIFILIDGMNYQAATENLGYLEHLVEYDKCAKYKVKGELPSLSRPMYESIMSGVAVHEHGILNNLNTRASKEKHIFSLCKDNHLTCAAIAYHWFCELYIKTPFHPLYDQIIDDGEEDIQHGFFYYEDMFPDSHIYSIAEHYQHKYHPDFMLVHPMNQDDAGHRYGCDSKEYHEVAMKTDTLLSSVIPLWLNRGYSVVVASDHGMNKMGIHGGNTKEQRESALYIIDPQFKSGDFSDEMVSTLQFAPLMCHILGIKPSKKMKALELKLND